MQDIINNYLSFTRAADIIAITFIVLFFVSMICALVYMPRVYDYSDKKEKIFKTSGVLFITSIVALIVITICCNINKASMQSALSDEIKLEYNVTVLDQDSINIANIDNGNPSKKIYARADSDSRVYECYIIKDSDGSYKLYTRNEKGIYLEVTGANKNELSE